MTPHRAPLPLRPRGPHRDDVLVALAGLAGGLALWWLGLFNNKPVAEERGALVLLPLAAMCLAALGRRAAQPWSLLLAVLALVGDALTGSLLATIVLFTDVVYAAVLYGSARLSRIVLPASVVVTAAALFGFPAALRTPESLLLGVVCGGITVTPAWTGAIVRDHRNAAAAERLRAEQTALLAEMDRTQAVTAERARMARELHDLVANHLSAIAIHSTAALSLERAPGGTATHEALRVIRENSVQGLAEMRRLIGLLRDADGAPGTVRDGAPSASPTLSGLDALLARAREAAEGTGLGFVLHDRRGTATGTGDGAGQDPGRSTGNGARPGTRPSLPAPVELAAYRVVQESVTNALKHAAPGTVTVQLAQQADHGPLTVRVTSPLAPATAPPGRAEPRVPGSGAGLIGMRERAELLGGRLRAGPAGGPEGGPADAGTYWEVRADLPVRGPVAEYPREKETREKETP